jgi:hypothetical protein
VSGINTQICNRNTSDCNKKQVVQTNRGVEIVEFPPERSVDWREAIQKLAVSNDEGRGETLVR